MRFHQPVDCLANNNNDKFIHSIQWGDRTANGNSVKAQPTHGSNQTLAAAIRHQSTHPIGSPCDANLNGNDEVDDIEDLSDADTNINRMITRGNLFKLKFNTNGEKRSGSVECLASSADESYMDDEGNRLIVSADASFPFLNPSFFASAPAEDFYTSPCPSVITSERKSYPRGIINPNYPGFQHLAHTLSEHFIDHHQGFSTMSDSEASEVEAEAQAAVATARNDQNGNGSHSDADGSRSISATSSFDLSENLSKVEEILRTVFESNSSLLSSAIERERDSRDDTSLTDDDDATDIGDELITCDLATYLRRYDSEAGVDLDVQSIIKSKKTASPAEPPDLIQKSDSRDSGFETSADKPDILQNVKEAACESPSGRPEREEANSQWSITPVDIVGDFEQEVKRELGLLMNGYDTRDDSPQTVDERNGSAEKSHENRKEKVRPERAIPFARNLITAKLFLLSQTIDAALSDANDSLNFASSATEVAVSASRNFPLDPKQRPQLPTAVVKPKHKRTPFDDRQLPLIPDVNREQPWFDKSSSVALTQPPTAAAFDSGKKSSSAKSERSSKKHHIESAHLSSSKVDVTDGDNNNAKSRPKEQSKSRRSVADKRGPGVAVVQPRKKEKMNEKLMETIVQMQIKKNSMDNRNNNRKNGAAAKNEADAKQTVFKESSGNSIECGDRVSKRMTAFTCSELRGVQHRDSSSGYRSGSH